LKRLLLRLILILHTISFGKKFKSGINLGIFVHFQNDSD
jgi:hypothetical protein